MYEPWKTQFLFYLFVSPRWTLRHQKLFSIITTYLYCWKVNYNVNIWHLSCFQVGTLIELKRYISINNDEHISFPSYNFSRIFILLCWWSAPSIVITSWMASPCMCHHHLYDAVPWLLHLEIPLTITKLDAHKHIRC